MVLGMNLMYAIDSTIAVCHMCSINISCHFVTFYMLQHSKNRPEVVHQLVGSIYTEFKIFIS
jgi:hypothetical protein